MLPKEYQIGLTLQRLILQAYETYIPECICKNNEQLKEVIYFYKRPTSQTFDRALKPPLPSHKNQPRFNQDKPSKLVSKLVRFNMILTRKS